MTDTPVPPVPPGPTPPARPPLRRSSDRVIGGVAGGVARWLDIDPTIVRVVLVVLAVFGGSGLLLYAVGWLLIPADDAPASSAQQLLDRAGRPGSANRVLLIILGVCVGLVALAGVGTLGVTDGPWDVVGGGTVLLLAAGGLVAWLIVRDGRGASAANQATPPASPVPPVPPAPVPGDTLVAPTGFAYGGTGGGYAGYVPPQPPTPVPPRPPRRRSYLGLAALSAAVLVMGVMATLSANDVVAIPAVVVLSTGLGILGLGMVVAAFAGRATWLLWFAVPLLLVVALVSSLPTGLLNERTWTAGDVRWQPTSAAQAGVPSRLTAGEAVLDLRELPPGEPVPSQITARVGFGTLIVLVPADRTVDIDASVGFGNIQVDGGIDTGGVGRTVRTTLPATTGDQASTLDLDLEVGFGTVEVSRG